MQVNGVQPVFPQTACLTGNTISWQIPRNNVQEIIIATMVKKMKSYRKELWFEIPTRRAFINITPQVNACLQDSGIKEGLALVNAMHITASVFINDDESGLHHDYEVWLEKLAPTPR